MFTPPAKLAGTPIGDEAAEGQSAVMLTNWLLITPLPPSPSRGYIGNKWIGFMRLRESRAAKVVISKSLSLESSKHSSYR